MNKMEPQTTKCSSCSKNFESTGPKTCPACHITGQINREKAKATANKIICQGKIASTKKPCTYEADPACGNKYCNKHVNWWIRDTREAKGQYSCYDIVRGCNNILVGKTTGKCDACLAKARIKDRARGKNTDDKNKELIKINKKKCKMCNKMFNLDEFPITSVGNIAEKCQSCFDKQAKIESKRGPRDRSEDYKKWYENGGKDIKKTWCERNPVDVKMYSINSRARKRLKNPEAVAEANRLYSAKRRTDPNKYIADQKKIKKSVKSQYGALILSTETKNRAMEISIDTFGIMCRSKCYYCDGVHCMKNVPSLNKNHKPELESDNDNGGLMGIDRMDSDIGYVDGNVVPACSVCNYTKNTHNESTFILLCMNIAFHQLKGSNGFDKLPNYTFGQENKKPNCTYRSYKSNAIKKRSLK
jgi:hypothetical protein